MQINKFLFVAYYTKKTPYEELVKKLQASLDSLNLPYDIQGYVCRGSWQSNIAFKPEFVMSMMMKHPDTDIVYIDADAIVQRYPVYFNTFDGDLGVHYKDGKELLSGTIYLRNNPQTLELVKRWVSEQQHHPQVWDQKILQRVVVASAKQLGVKVVDIPATYTQIFDTMKSAGTPIIEHFQASRQNKSTDTEKFCYPTIIEGQRVRILTDGTFAIARQHKKAEAFLDSAYSRIPGELRWYPSDPGGRRIRTLQHEFMGKNVFIVGKGPSLDKLSKEQFGDVSAPIIGINEAIHKIETLDLPNPLYVMQQDTWLKENCRPKNKSTKIILLYRARGLYLDWENRYVFIAPEVGAPIACLTASYAICMSNMFECKSITMVSFDSCVNQATAYAKCIGYEPTTAGDPRRFLKHRKAFEVYLGKTPVSWVLPGA